VRPPLQRAIAVDIVNRYLFVVLCFSPVIKTRNVDVYICSTMNAHKDQQSEEESRPPTRMMDTDAREMIKIATIVPFALPESAASCVV
jgi:hypothetical protein